MYTEQEAIEQLRAILRPGDTVHTILRHVSQSGMTRAISVILTDKNGPRDISWLVAQAGLGRFDRKNDGVRVSGCGMDMGFHLVYGLARTLWPNGHRCAGKRCKSNDHSNTKRDGRSKHHDGGYALDQRWL